jgi:hypothetical protein
MNITTHQYAVPKLRMFGFIHPLPRMSSMLGARLIEYKDNFTFTVYYRCYSYYYGCTVLYWVLAFFFFFLFLYPLHSRCASLDGGSALRKTATYTQDKTDTE